MQLEILNQSGQLKCIKVPKGTKVVIVEGFESVGKTTMMDKLVERSQYVHLKDQEDPDKDPSSIRPLLNLWKPNYSSMTKSFLPYDGRYILNLALLDMIVQSVLTLSDGEVLLVDRGLISGIVYSALKGQDNQKYLLNSDFLDYVQGVYSSDFIYHIYVKPQSLEDSLTLYRSSQSDSTRLNDEYDMMSDFRLYYSEYQDADELFMKSMADVCGGRYCIVEPINYDTIATDISE